MATPKVNLHLTKLTSTQEQEFLELYDYCNAQTKADQGKEIRTIDEHGLLSHTNAHWYQTMCEFILPVLIGQKHHQLWLDVFCRICIQHKAEHPVDWLYRKWKKDMAGESLYENIVVGGKGSIKMDKEAQERTEKRNKEKKDQETPAVRNTDKKTKAK